MSYVISIHLNVGYVSLPIIKICQNHDPQVFHSSADLREALMDSKGSIDGGGSLGGHTGILLLMAEILHHLGCMKPYE